MYEIYTIMKKIKTVLVLLITLSLFSCPSNNSDNKTVTTHRESRAVDVTYILNIEHDETIALKSKQDIATYYPGGIQEITISGEYTETIAGLSVRSGDEVKLAFTDATNCHPEDDCIYTAVLSLKVNGTAVATRRFNCSNGNGSGEVAYTFD